MCCSRRTTKVDSLRNVRGVKSAKKIGNNTFEVIYKDGCKAIRLHRTDIITYRPDGSYILNTDGWQTVTTKRRINWHLWGKWCDGLTHHKERAKIHFDGTKPKLLQKDHRWYVLFPKYNKQLDMYDMSNTIPYHDYMVFDSSGVYESDRERLHNHEKGGLELC